MVGPAKEKTELF